MFHCDVCLVRGELILENTKKEQIFNRERSGVARTNTLMGNQAGTVTPVDIVAPFYVTSKALDD
jgi:hypothetical protein